MSKKMILVITLAFVVLLSSSLSWGANQVVVVREAGTNNLYSAVCPTPCTFSSMAYSTVVPNSSMVPVVAGTSLGWVVVGTDTATGCLYKGTFNSNGIFNNDWAVAGLNSTGACIKPNLSDVVYFADAAQTPSSSVPPACSYAYSNGPCQPNGTMTASVMSATPAGCLGTPVSVQSCIYTGPPACTGANVTAWGACQPNGTQTATSYTATPSGCTGTPPASALTQNCQYVQPTNPCTSYTYTLGACSNNTAPVLSYVGIPSGCAGGATPATSQPCTSTPPPTNGLGTEGVPVTMQISGSGAAPWYGELDFSLQMPRNGSALVVNMSSTDWSTGQSVIIGLSPVTCSQIVGRGQFGPTMWSGGATPSNFIVTASSAFTAGQTVYISVCNRSNYTGGFKITWTESN